MDARLRQVRIGRVLLVVTAVAYIAFAMLVFRAGPAFLGLRSSG